MISAKEARDISATLSKEAARDLVDLDEEIKNVASRGERSFWHDGYIHKQAIEVLKTLGYELKVCDSQIDGYSIQIRW